MKVYEAISKSLAREHVAAVFGLMGDGNLKLIPCLTTDYDVAFYSSRHEAGSVAMAQGYARVTGEVGVCTFTQGPGLTNALTALISAHRSRTPLIVLCGDTPTAVRGLPQDIDQAPIFAAAGLAVEDLSVDNAVTAVANGFARAREERRPIVLNLPTDLQDLECDWVDVEARAPARAIPAPGEAELTAAAAAIDAAQRPVVIAGRGAMGSGAREAIVAFAERAGALLATSLPAKDWFAGEPFDVGIAGGFASDTGRDLIGGADCVIVFGASLNHFTSRGGSLFAPGTTIVQCDSDPAAFGRFMDATLTVTGDAAAIARSLAERLSARTGYRVAGVAGTIAAAAPALDESEPRGIDPRTLSRVVDHVLPDDRTLVVDGGHFMGFPAMFVAVPHPSQFVFTLDFGSIGLGLSAAIGAAIGRPGSVTVAAVGDGGLMMNLGELDTAVRYRLPLVIVVYNDGAYGAEMHFLRMLDLPDAESLFAVPALDGVARALGATGLCIETIDELEAALSGGLERLDGPLLLDCKITRNVRAGWLDEAFERGAH